MSDATRHVTRKTVAPATRFSVSPYHTVVYTRLDYAVIYYTILYYTIPL